MSKLSINPKDYWDDFPTLVKQLPYVDGFTEYMNGAYKTCLINSNEGLPKSYLSAYKYYLDKYDVYDLQVFCTLSECTGLGWHTDHDDVIIACLYGNSKYKFDKEGNDIILKEGETIYIPRDKMHIGLGDINPRIILSMATNKEITRSEVTYHYNYLT